MENDGCNTRISWTSILERRHLHFQSSNWPPTIIAPGSSSPKAQFLREVLPYDAQHHGCGAWSILALLLCKASVQVGCGSSHICDVLLVRTTAPFMRCFCCAAQSVSSPRVHQWPATGSLSRGKCFTSVSEEAITMENSMDLADIEGRSMTEKTWHE